MTVTTGQAPVMPGASAGRRIVVGTDGSEGGDGAVVWAAVQALEWGSVLEVVTSFGTGYVLVAQQEAQDAMDTVLRDAQALAERTAPGVVVKTTSYPGSPDVILLEEAVGADLLVVGSRGLGGFKGRLLGSVSRRCVHRSPCPVVVVKDGPDAVTARRAGSTHTIMVGVDGSPTSTEAVESAVALAERSAAAVEAVAAWEYPASYGTALSIPSDWDPAADCREILAKVLAPVQAAHPGVAIRSTVVQGHPAQVLDERSDHAELLVLGCRGHGELVDMFLGSVSEYCVVHARCTVLVIRHRDGADA